MRQLLTALLLLLLSPTLLASNSERLREAKFAQRINQEQATLELKNQAVLSYLWADVYAAAFYAEPHTSARQALGKQHSKRLELYYFRDIARQDVIDAAWSTLKRQQRKTLLESLRDDLNALHASFRDIRVGDRYALDYQPASGLRLIRNDTTVFSSNNPQLAAAYLAIWLAPKGLSEKLRTQLLSEHPANESSR